MTNPAGVHVDPGDQQVIWTVTTVKDSLANLDRFVDRNLDGGADHLVVFVDDDSELLEFLSGHPHTTGIAAEAWWGSGRPDALNSRQRIAANAVRAVASRLGDVDWLFHVDGDEVIQVDRRQLGELAGNIQAVRLGVLEAVAEWETQPAHQNLFKRRLSKMELRTLVARGALSRARNDHYFHGHVNGKVGVRPQDGLWLGIHRAMDAKRDAVEAFEAPWLRMLHYESASGPDFVRKWQNLLGSGTEASIRSARSAIADAVRAELQSGDDDTLTRLRRVFMETTADDVDTLRELGYLEEVDPLLCAHEPNHYGRSDDLLGQLQALAVEDKRVFEPERDPDDADAVLRRIIA